MLLIMYRSCRSLPLLARLNPGFPPRRPPHFDRSCCPFASGTPGADCSWRRASLVVVGGGVDVDVVVVVAAVAVAVVIVGRSETGWRGPWCIPAVGEGGGRVPWPRRPERRVENASAIVKGSCAVGRWSRKGKVDVS